MAWRLWVLHHSIQSSRPAPGLLFDLRTGVFVQLKVHYTASSSGDAGRRCYAAARRGLDELRLHRVGALLLRGPSEEARKTGKLTDDDVAAWRAVWKSTSVSGSPSWLGRAVRNRHRHAIEACVDGVEVEATIQHERAVKF